MKVFYLALLWQEGNRLHGTGEKVFEDANGRVHEYIGDKRVRVQLSGYVTKRYFAKDEIVIHMEQEGRVRHSSSVHSLTIESPEFLRGHGVATAANSILRLEYRKGDLNEISYRYSKPTTRRIVDED